MVTPPPSRRQRTSSDGSDGSGSGSGSGEATSAPTEDTDVSAAETLCGTMRISDVESSAADGEDRGAREAARTRRITVAHDPDADLPPGLGAPDIPVERVSEPIIVLPLMPTPDAIPIGHPDDPWPPPGQVPPGDSRSLRRGEEFALVYREGAAIVTRFGVVGRRGQWRVVEYPNIGAASHAYAKECSRWASDGFVDYRGP